MNFILECFKFFIYSGLIVVISKYVLVPVLRKLAESLNLKAKTVGNITGITTSVPELLTTAFSAFTGLAQTSIFNIISSNIINLVQYIASIYFNKNQKILGNKAVKSDLIMSVLTIIIPLIFLALNISFSINIIPIFILLFLLFYFINHQTHKLYLSRNKIQEEEIEQEAKWIKGKKKVIIKYTIYLIVIAVILFFIGNLLSITLEKLCTQFKISQVFIGILLGIITSIPELITFFESQKHYNKKETHIYGVVEATNNLLTSNMLNVFVIQSIGIIIYSL